jgi:hypothetical protein
MARARVLPGLLVLAFALAVVGAAALTLAGCSLLLDFGGDLDADAAPADAGATDAAPFLADAPPADAPVP